MRSAEEYLSHLNEAAGFLRREAGAAPAVAVVLGSGLSRAESWPVGESVPFESIPHFSHSGVPGHPGRLWSVATGESRLAVLAGRHHFYEGYSLAEVVFPVRVLAWWGVKDFILTNAAGGINPRLEPGCLMLIRDHINLMGDSPLRGVHLPELGERFVDMRQAYDLVFRALASDSAGKLGLELEQGVYAAVPGPNFETPAEIRMLETLGADAVGMSTVPEVIALSQMRRRVLGLSVITNRAAGLVSEPLSHKEVLRVTAAAGDCLARLILLIAESLEGQATPLL